MPDTEISGHRAARASFEARVAEIRPKLHRYCARMVGSALDAEDIVQESLANAFFNWPEAGVDNLEAWLFRIAHNRAIDHLRRSERVRLEPLGEIPVEAEEVPPLQSEELTTFAVSIFLQLTPLQRSALILKDVLGYSLAEVSEMLDLSVGGIKSAVHRGRANLRKIAVDVEAVSARRLDDDDKARLKDYVDRFLAHDFDAIRARLVEDVTLDLVQRERRQGADRVGHYFTNYSQVELASIAPAMVEGRPAMLVSDADGSYVVLLAWRDGGLAAIRDFRYARYVMDSVTVQRVD